MLDHWSEKILANQTPSLLEPDQATLPIDWEHLHKLSDGNTDFELELLQIFVDDSHTHLESLKRAIASQNFQQAEQEAHHLKGASANVGAIAMQLVAETLEQQALQHQLKTTEPLLTNLQATLQQIQAFLHKQLHKAPLPPL